MSTLILTADPRRFALHHWIGGLVFAAGAAHGLAQALALLTRGS